MTVVKPQVSTFYSCEQCAAATQLPVKMAMLIPQLITTSNSSEHFLIYVNYIGMSSAV